MAGRFTRAELGLVGSAAAMVFSRVLAFSLATIGFTEFARSLDGIPPGWHDWLAGAALGAYGLAMAGAQLLAGTLSDRLGRRNVLLAGTAVFVLGSAVSALAGDIWLLLAGRLLAGLGGVSSVALAAVGETVAPQRRTLAMAMVGMPAGGAVFLGFLVGPPLAGLIGFSGIFWVTAALGIVASVGILARPLPAPRPGLASPARSFGRPAMALALVGFTVNFAMVAALYDAQSGILARTGQWGLAAMLGLAFVAMLGVSHLVDRQPQASAWLPVLAALAVLAVAAPAFRLAGEAWSILAAGALFFAAHAVLSAILPAQVSRIAGRSGGRGHGVQLVVAYLGSACGAVAAGGFAAGGRYAGVFVALALVAAVAGSMVAASLRRASPAPEVQPA